MSEGKAVIWVTPLGGAYGEPVTGQDTVYIRADIAQRLAEALRDARRVYGTSGTAVWSKVDAALAEFDALMGEENG